METIFNLCVSFLKIIVGLTGLSYQVVNVILFCFIWPALTLYLIYKLYSQKQLLKKLSEGK